MEIKTIMIVGEESINLDLLKKYLKNYKFELVSVENSRRAIEMIEDNEKSNIDLILLNTNIPNTKEQAFFPMKTKIKMNIDTSNHTIFLKKPFTKDQFVNFINKNIDIDYI